MTIVVFVKILNQTSAYEAMNEAEANAWMEGISLMAHRAGLEKSVWFAKDLPHEAGIDGESWMCLDDRWEDVKQWITGLTPR